MYPVIICLLLFPLTAGSFVIPEYIQNEIISKSALIEHRWVQKRLCWVHDQLYHGFIEWHPYQ